MGEIFTYLVSWIQQFIDGISELFSVFELPQLFMSVLFVYLTYRFLLVPVFNGSSGGSDTVRRSNKDKER